MVAFGPSGRLPSDTTKDFSRGPKANIQRSVFDRSFGLKTTIDAGYLYPIYFDQVYPSDTFQMEAHGFGRLNTPIHPIMDNLYLETFYFFVPYRLIWTNWQRFMGERDNPTSSIDYLCPQITANTVASKSLYDYFGLPVGTSISYNNFAGRAYNLIWNEWFRAQWIQDSVTVDLDDGPDTATDYVLLKRGKRFDYYTSALPNPQAGGNAVKLPLGTEAPVHGIGTNTQTYPYTSGNVYETGQTGTVNYANYKMFDPSGADGSIYLEEDPNNSGYPNIIADLSEAASATINQLRESFQLQAFLERSQIGGQRYKEIIYSMFGTLTGDARLDRPEFLGSGRSRINVTPIPQTSSTDTTTPQANMSGYGTVGFSGHKFSKSFTEHGCVVGLACVFSDLNYFQGIAREWSYRDRYDFYWPAFAHLGEQGILNQEIFVQNTSDDSGIFGYAEKYAELRYKNNQLTGLMRPNVTGTLDAWHLAQDFTALPALNSSFIEEDPPIDRIVATATQPDLFLDIFFKLRCARPLPMYATPITLSRF
mgnify:CR=1 FL=1